MSKVRGFTWTVADHDLLSKIDTWGDVLVELGHHDKRIVTVTADLATTTKLARFKKEFPGRSINVGIAEQNMIAVAGGLAAMGLVPVVCSYATFAILRAAEFVRTDIAYPGRNVKIIGTLAGVAFGQGGPTHHSIEDLALMRAIPGMTILVPSDGAEMAEALRAAIAHEGPVYIRYGRGTEPPSRPGEKFTIGKTALLRGGSDVTVFACGSVVHEAVGAAERAASQGLLNARVIAVPTLKPLDESAIVAAIRETRRIVTVEDHSVIGGLGSAIEEVVVKSGMACAFKKLGHQDRFLCTGVPEDLMHLGGFDEDAIFAALCELRNIAPPTENDWGQDA
jgi:transketolase